MASQMFETISLQELITKPLLAVPDPFIQIDQEHPILSPTALMSTIPIIDMENFSQGNTKAIELEKLHSTCKEWGIFQVINHGLTSCVVEKLKHEVQEFYKLPLDEKMKYSLRPGDVEGYGQTIVNLQDQKYDWADRFLMVMNPIHRRKPYLLPELPSSLREALEAYSRETQKLAMNLFELIGQALRIEKREVENIFDDGLQIVRMTYYPPCPKPELVVGLRPHTDSGALTILLQVNGVDGLQVRKDGVWIPVNVLPSALVVNIGDIMEIFSNGAYKSVEHRATVNSMSERISVGMFFNPKLEADIGPAASRINHDQNPPIFKRVAMEKYLEDFFSRKLQSKTVLEEMRIEREESKSPDLIAIK